MRKNYIIYLLKRKHEVLEDQKRNVDPERRLFIHRTENMELNENCWNRFQNNRRICVIGALLQEQARKFASKLKNDSHMASNGSLESFRKRHNILFRLISGQRGNVNTDPVSHWNEKPKLSCNGYMDFKHFNIDKSTVFLKRYT